MTKWPQVWAGDVLQLVRRPVDPDPATNYVEIGVRSFGNGIFHKPPVTGADIGKKRVFEIGPHELVINIVFAWEGAVAASSDDEIGMIGSHRFLTYQGDPERVDLDFVRAYLVSDPGRVTVTAASPGSAGRNRTLSQAGFEQLMIPLPPLDEQRRIAARVNAVGERAKSIAGRTARSLKLADGLRESAIASAVKSCERSPLGGLVQSAREAVAIDSGRMYEQIGIKSFGKGLIRYPRICGENLSKLRYFRFPVPSLAVSNIQAWEGALCKVEEPDAHRVASNRFYFYTPRNPDDLDIDFLLAFLLTRDGAGLVRAASPGTTIRNKTLSVALFEAIEVPLPSISVQRRIAKVLGFLDQVEREHERVARTVKALRAAAVNEVFSGRV